MVIIISLLKYYLWNSETTAAGWAIFTDFFYEDFGTIPILRQHIFGLFSDPPLPTTSAIVTVF